MLYVFTSFLWACNSTLVFLCLLYLPFSFVLLDRHKYSLVRSHVETRYHHPTSRLINSGLAAASSYHKRYYTNSYFVPYLAAFLTLSLFLSLSLLLVTMVPPLPGIPSASHRGVCKDSWADQETPGKRLPFLLTPLSSCLYLSISLVRSLELCSQEKFPKALSSYLMPSRPLG